MVFLAAVLWNTGSLVTHAQASRTVPETIQFKDPESLATQLPAVPPPCRPAGHPTTPTDRASLSMPIAGVDPHTLKTNFSEARGGHAHEALDIMAPRGTPVLAVAEGNVVKFSPASGAV